MPDDDAPIPLVPERPGPKPDLIQSSGRTCIACSAPMRENARVCANCGHIRAPDPARRQGRREARAIECPECGYDLRGLRESTCPECGITITQSALRIAARKKRDRGRTLLGFLLPAGLLVAGLGVALLIALASGGRYPPLSVAIIFGAEFAACAVLYAVFATVYLGWDSPPHQVALELAGCIAVFEAMRMCVLWVLGFLFVPWMIYAGMSIVVAFIIAKVMDLDIDDSVFVAVAVCAIGIFTPFLLQAAGVI